MSQLVPNPVERKYFLQWLSYKLQHPHVPGPAIVMVAHSRYGTGRTTFGHLLSRLFGSRYVKNIEFKTLTGQTYQSQYNEWQATAVVVVVNESSEIVDNSVYRSKHNAYEALKDKIDPRGVEREIKVKGIANYSAVSSTSYVVATNHYDAFPIEENDRRCVAVSNGEPREQAYWDALNAWLDDPANVAAFYRWLLTVDLTGYNPYASPPQFEAKLDMVEAARSDIDRAFDEAVEKMPAQVMTVSQITASMAGVFDDNDDYKAPDNWRVIVGRLAARKLHRVGVRNGTNWRIRNDTRYYAVYAKSKTVSIIWATRAGLREEVLRNGAIEPASLGRVFRR